MNYGDNQAYESDLFLKNISDCWVFSPTDSVTKQLTPIII